MSQDDVSSSRNCCGSITPPLNQVLIIMNVPRRRRDFRLSLSHQRPPSPPPLDIVHVLRRRMDSGDHYRTVQA
ncbi:hypothetical protein B0H34DRAFT_795251 [Crassisporium funariophilum]|nr:hypothetical protein B0H34DRAFT_795251 [Crassisporium funariophilum]